MLAVDFSGIKSMVRSWFLAENNFDYFNESFVHSIHPTKRSEKEYHY